MKDKRERLHLNLRVEPDTHALITLAAKDGGRSINQEISDRLRRSFEEDERANQFAAIMRELAKITGEEYAA